MRPFLATFRDTFLLEGASRKIATRSRDRQLRIRELYDAAQMRLTIAVELVDPRRHGAAWALLKEAAILYVQALSISSDASACEHFELATFGEQLDSLEARGSLPHAPPELAALSSLVLEADWLAFDRLSHDEALALRAQVDRAIAYLRDQVEPRTEHELKVVRGVRLGALGAIVLVALSLVGWRALSPKNIARGKPVVASSQHPQSLASPDGLTDGSTSGAYGVHTQAEDDAWVMVDLQSIQKVGEIKVFNRGDGYFDEGLPLSLELSEDGATFAEIDRRTTSFSRWKPWTFDAAGKRARYVRVKKVGRGYVALSELEVYGAP